MEAILDINFYDYYSLVRKSDLINSIVETIAKVERCQLYLSGGVLRNAIWNTLHFREDFLYTDDCDILYYDNSIEKNFEKDIEAFLQSISPNFKWSVKNQARMHLRNKHKPYSSVSNALEFFPETASAIAIDANWNIIAPFGFHDILTLTLKPTPFCHKNEIQVFNRRVALKKWLTNFENLMQYNKNHLNLQKQVWTM